MAYFHPVGIDLGTTLSAAALIDQEGASKMLRHREGKALVPSVVFFGDGDVVVGEAAKRAGRLEPEQVAYAAKRDMGKSHYQRPIRGKMVPSEVIQSCILRKLRAQIIDIIGGSHKAVITVPAYFDEARRKATADAGQISGLDVLDIVNEPTAAALAFGEQLGYINAAGAPRDPLTLLVYDLGGGTFDATVVRLDEGEIVTLATDGDAELGGVDWDLRIVDFLVGKFRERFKDAPKIDESGMNQARDIAQATKHALTDELEAAMVFDYAGRKLEVALARSEFESLAANLLERTLFTTRQTLKAAGLLWSDVDRLLLVGGSSRMPMVRRALETMSGLVPDTNVSPDEAVARGAAIYAQHLLAVKNIQSSVHQLSITDVNAHSLGIEGINQASLRKENAVVIPRNSPLPVEVHRTFVTKHDNQQSIKVQLLEGESTLPGECRELATAAIRNLPPGNPEGTKIDVVYRFDANGRLSVRAKVAGTGGEARIELERMRGLDDQRVNQWKQIISLDGGFESIGKAMFEKMDLQEWFDEADAAPLEEKPDDKPAKPTSEPAVPYGAPQAAADTLRGEVKERRESRAVSPPDLHTSSEDSDASGRGILSLVISVVGFVVFSALGLVVGYYLLCLINPESNFLHWDLPGLKPPVP